MTRRILLVEISSAVTLPVVTPVLPRSTRWAPVAYTPPPLPVPTEVILTPVGDGCQMQFKLPTQGMQTVVEVAPDVAGVPGTWKLYAATAGFSLHLPLANGEKKWVRFRNVKNGRSSDYTAAQLATGIKIPGNLVTGGDDFARSAMPGMHNPAFEAVDPDLADDFIGWARYTGTGGPSAGFTIATAGGINDSKCLSKTGGTPGQTVGWYNTGRLVVEVGQVIELMIAVKSELVPGGATTRVAFGLRGYDAAGTAIADIGGYDAAGTIAATDCNGVWVVFRKVVTVTNASVREVSFAFSLRDYAGSGRWYFDNCSMRGLVKSQDDVPDGTAYARVRSGGLLAGVVRGVVAGTNMIPNPNFVGSTSTTIGAVLTASAPLCDHWQLLFGAGSFWQAIHEAAGSILLRFRNDVVLPGNPASYPAVTVYGDAVDVEPGRSYRVRTTGSASRSATPPAGFSFIHRMQIAWYTAAGAFVSFSQDDLYSIGAADHDRVWSAPATAYRAIMSLVVAVNNGTASAMSPSGQYWADLRFSSAMFKLAADLDSEVSPGATYGRLANADLVDSSGVSRLGLRVAGSGHRVGDQRNLHPITFGSIRSRWDGLTISYSVPTTGSPATVTINVSAATLRGGSFSASYSASSTTVSQARSTTQVYHLYYTDPGAAGGALALNITTDPNALANNDGRVWIGQVSVTVPAAGTGGSGSGGAGGGCVEASMFMPGGIRADAWWEGLRCECWSPEDGLHCRATQAVGAQFVTRCVRLVMESGHTLIVSADTPIDAPHDVWGLESVTAAEMCGRLILRSGALDGRCVGSERVCDVQDVGDRWVVPISFGGVSFPAGADPGALYFTHNVEKP